MTDEQPDTPVIDRCPTCGQRVTTVNARMVLEHESATAEVERLRSDRDSWRQCSNEFENAAHALEAKIKEMREGWDADVAWANKLLLERDEVLIIRDKQRAEIERLHERLHKIAALALELAK